MKKLFIFFSSLILVITSSANHIVGGEMEFITLEPGKYRINLIQYRDEAQTENLIIDTEVTVKIFSNKNATLMGEFTLPFINVNDVAYTKPECAIASLKTSRIVYSLDITLDPKRFQDEEGYYVAWERCCRNKNIKNIVAPDNTGMKYIVEFPPLYKNNKPFINTSPTLLKPLSDYACINQLYYTNFTGVDTDGDSLVYRLAVPLNTNTLPNVNSGSAFIPTFPKPNVPITWAVGYSLENTIHGSQPLRISPRGLLTVNPSETGLYVFSVIVEEWRNQRKIGEVQRDFQMLVIDGCDPPDPPDVGIEVPGRPTFNADTDILKYSVVEEKCFDFIVTNIKPGERISLRAEPVNFEQDLENPFTVTSVLVGLGQDTLIVQVCAPRCPPVRDEPFIIDLIAADDACPLPQMDTLRLQLQIEPPKNQLPVADPISASFFINQSDVLTIPFHAEDPDGEFMSASLKILNVEEVAARGFTFEITENVPGVIEGNLTWDTDCLVYDFSDRQYFRAGITFEDADSCSYTDPIIQWIDLNVILPPNSSPKITANTPLSITVSPKEVVEFDVNVTDADGDPVALSLSSPDASVSDLGIAFNSVGGNGVATGKFQWPIDCSNLNILSQDQFVFYFIADDDDYCQVKNYDSLEVVVIIDRPANSAPQIDKGQRIYEVGPNGYLSFEIAAMDSDLQDSLTLRLSPNFILPKQAPPTFLETKGIGTVSSTFEWQLNCELLDFGQTRRPYDIVFLVTDDRCPVAKSDTFKIQVVVREDREAFNRFLPPNVFTPNGDGFNDTYTLTNLAGANQNLPEDNCDNQFEYFTVVDRNGNAIYTTTTRDFVFTGNNVESGVYYYVVKYTRNEYKGFLQILY